MTITGSVTPFTDLITSEHASKPNFLATVSALCQPFADNIAVAGTMPTLFDLQTAEGQQLDFIGQWVGISRYLPEPLTGVYFAFDISGVGFDQGTWYNAFNPTTGLVALADPQYRTLLGAKIALNNWDGTVPGAYAVWNTLFPTGPQVLIQDNQDMTMTYAILSTESLDAVTLALFEGGFFSLKPAGVQINFFMTPTLPGAPFFGFDAEGTGIAGFDVGAWGAVSPGY